jgi:ferredoxin
MGYTGFMRVRVDREKCTGHGRCYVLAPDVFEADDEGYCVLPRDRVTPEQADAARRGALNCPEDAIEISEEED